MNGAHRSEFSQAKLSARETDCRVGRGKKKKRSEAPALYRAHRTVCVCVSTLGVREEERNAGGEKKKEANRSEQET